MLRQAIVAHMRSAERTGGALWRLARHPRQSLGDARTSADILRDLCAGGLVVAVAPDHPSVEPLDRPRLPLVQALALGNAFDHVDHHDGASEALLRQPLGRGGPHVAGADDGDLLEHACPALRLRC